MPTEPEVVVVQGGVPSKVVWQVELIVGVITLGLGIALTFHPSTSLSVVCVFIGALLILGGIFHFIRALDHDEEHRAWVAIAGLLEVVIGVVGTGISRAEDRTEWLAGRVAPSSEGVKAKTALVLCTWQIRSGERPACRRTQ